MLCYAVISHSSRYWAPVYSILHYLISSHHMLHPSYSIPPLLFFLLFLEQSLLSALMPSKYVNQLEFFWHYHLWLKKPFPHLNDISKYISSNQPLTLPPSKPLSCTLNLFWLWHYTSCELNLHTYVFVQPTMLQWIEIATKLFNTDSRCCEWFMNTMAEDDWWPQQILIKCPNHTVRQVSHHPCCHRCHRRRRRQIF